MHVLAFASYSKIKKCAVPDWRMRTKPMIAWYCFVKQTWTVEFNFLLWMRYLFKKTAQSRVGTSYFEATAWSFLRENRACFDLNILANLHCRCPEYCLLLSTWISHQLIIIEGFWIRYHCFAPILIRDVLNKCLLE